MPSFFKKKKKQPENTKEILEAFMLMQENFEKLSQELDKIKKDNKIIEFKEKPKLNYYMGYSIIEKEAFNYITKDLLNTKGEEGWTLFFQKIISMGKMRAYYHEGLNITFNTHSQKKIADNIFKYYTYWGENEE